MGTIDQRGINLSIALYIILKQKSVITKENQQLAPVLLAFVNYISGS